MNNRVQNTYEELLLYVHKESEEFQRFLDECGTTRMLGMYIDLVIKMRRAIRQKFGGVPTIRLYLNNPIEKPNYEN